MDRISIIVPTHNRTDILSATLDSYFEQGCREVIVVDDAGTDGTSDMLARTARQRKELKVIRHRKRLGAPACRNSGAAAAEGEYILFGEDDLTFASDYAEVLLGCAVEHDADVMAGRLIYLLQGESEDQALARADARRGRLLNPRLLIGDLSLKGDEDTPFILLHACSLIRRSVWDELRYYEDYPVNGYREESDFYVRCAKAGYNLFFCPHTACYHLPREIVTGGGQWRNSPWRYRYWAVRNNIRFLRRHYGYLREELGLRESMHRLIIHQALYESGKALTYAVRHRYPRVYGALAKMR
ncbi:MAG: glycosyltransferase [bacterium]|nr:glycosyltransferase [bacterium]